MTFDSQAYATQLEDKVTRLRDLLAPFDAPSRPCSTRRCRTSACAPNSACGAKPASATTRCFPGRQTHADPDRRIPDRQPAHQPVDAAAQGRLASQFGLSHKLFQVEFLTTLAGDAMITLCYHRPLDEHWHAAASKLAAD
jgi:tRNA (uracil-5-)-methyltransferase